MVGVRVSLGVSLSNGLLQNMVVDKLSLKYYIFKSCIYHYHLGIGLPLLASKVDEGSDLVHSAVGQCNGVDHMVGKGNWGVMDKGGVVDDTYGAIRCCGEGEG